MGALLVEQFIRCSSPVPTAVGARGPGFCIAVAAHSLAGVGLIVGERVGGRRRLEVVAARHTALLAEVARDFPLIFLEQVGPRVEGRKSTYCDRSYSVRCVHVLDRTWAMCFRGNEVDSLGRGSP